MFESYLVLVFFFKIIVDLSFVLVIKWWFFRSGELRIVRFWSLIVSSVYFVDSVLFVLGSRFVVFLILGIRYVFKE